MKKIIPIIIIIIIIGILVLSGLGAVALPKPEDTNSNKSSTPIIAMDDDFNEPGNVLISDQFNNRVIETSPNGNIVWSFGLGPLDFSANSPLGVN